MSDSQPVSERKKQIDAERVAREIAEEIAQTKALLEIQVKFETKRAN